MKLPPVPKWNAATDDLDSGDFFARAQDFERSFLPLDMVFPRTGQIWEALRDCEVGFVASFNAPSVILPFVMGAATPIPFGKARLSRGERVRVEFADEPKPLVIWFLPLRYEELHENIVPTEVRQMSGYSQYRLTLRTVRTACCLGAESDYFLDVFKLVEDAV